MMNYFRDPTTKQVYAYPADGSDDDHISADLILMSATEVEAHLHPTPRPMSAEQLATVERAWRDTTLGSVLWLRERHRDEQDLQLPLSLTGAQFVELLSYLQKLRDWPQSAKFPAEQSRPVAPPWIAEQRL